MSRRVTLSRREFVHGAIVHGVALVTACRSDEIEQPPMTPPTETREQPVSSTSQPFRLDAHQYGGRQLATARESSGASILVHEWSRWLRVRSDEQVGVLIVTRREGDSVGAPVGYFRRRLDERQLDALRRGVESAPWAKLDPPVGGDVFADHHFVDYHRGDLLIQRGFNSENHEFIAAIAPYIDAVDAIMNFIAETPAGLLEAKVHASVDAHDPSLHQLGLVLENRGAGPVVLTDPRLPPEPGAQLPRAYLRVAPATNGWTEPSWQLLGLPALAEGQPRTTIIPAGGRIEYVVPWRAQGIGSYYLQGGWFDYGGPVEAAPDQLPFIPLAQDGVTPPMQGPFPIRGAAFAEGIALEVRGADR